VVGLAFIFVFTVLAIAQSENNQLTTFNKIAVIDTFVFHDKQKGIKRLIQAINFVRVEGYKLYDLEEKIEKLKKEIFCLESQNKSVDEKKIELQKLEDEFKRTEAEKKALYEKQHSIIVTPVAEKISEKLKEFAKLKGYKVVVDKFSLLEPSITIVNEWQDITSEFIEFCNDYFEKEKLK
jgi:Skp family chaperone for outer membrane proteins